MHMTAHQLQWSHAGVLLLAAMPIYGMNCPLCKHLRQAGKSQICSDISPGMPLRSKGEDHNLQYHTAAAAAAELELLDLLSKSD